MYFTLPLRAHIYVCIYIFYCNYCTFTIYSQGSNKQMGGGYDGKEESSIDDTPKCPLGAGGRSCPWIAGQTVTDASVSERRWGAWTGHQR